MTDPHRHSTLHVILGLCCFMPYVSPGTLIPAQVQPWAALIAWGMIFVAALTTGKIVRDNVAFVLLGLSLIMLIYVSPYATGLAYFKKTVGIPLSIAIAIVARKVSPKSLQIALTISISIYLAFAILQYVSTGVYLSIAKLFVDVVNIHIGERGAASLAPEATDFGFTMAYLFLFALMLRRALSRLTPPLTLGRFIIPMILLALVLSKSASGIMTLVLVLIAINAKLFFSARTLIQGLLGVGVLTVILVLLPESLIENVRGLRLLFVTVSNPELLLQTSFAHRAVHNVVGVIALVESGGLGHGAGSFTTIGPEIYQRYGLGEAMGLSSYHKGAVLDTLQTVALGVIPQLLTEYGIIGVAFISIVFWRVLSSNLDFKYAAALIMLITWLQSFPIAYPMFWLLLGLTSNPAFTGNLQKKSNQAALVPATNRVG